MVVVPEASVKLSPPRHYGAPPMPIFKLWDLDGQPVLYGYGTTAAIKKSQLEFEIRPSQISVMALLQLLF